MQPCTKGYVFFAVCIVYHFFRLKDDCLSFQGKILVGTKDSEIIEITEKTAASQVRILTVLSNLFSFVGSRDVYFTSLICDFTVLEFANLNLVKFS